MVPLTCPSFQSTPPDRRRPASAPPAAAAPDRNTLRPPEARASPSSAAPRSPPPTFCPEPTFTCSQGRRPSDPTVVRTFAASVARRRRGRRLGLTGPTHSGVVSQRGHVNVQEKQPLRRRKNVPHPFPLDGGPPLVGGGAIALPPTTPLRMLAPMSCATCPYFAWRSRSFNELCPGTSNR